jgi:undecaprenyl-diphosphatase
MHGDLVRFGIGAAVLVVSALVARQGVPDWEERLFRWVFASPDGLERILWLPMQLGSAWAPLVAALLIWVLVREWRPTVGCLVIGLGAWWAAKAVKAVVDRGRPASVLTHVEARDGTPLDGLGYLSGHVTVAFAVVTVLAPYLTRRARVVAYGLGVVVAMARVQVGAHLPLDVIGGAAFGTLLGAIWYLLVGFRNHTSWLERRAARRARERAGEPTRADADAGLSPSDRATTTPGDRGAW